MQVERFMSQTLSHPFEPIVFDDTHTLILGSFPSIESFKKSFYYAHPRNQFWDILSRLTNYPALTRDQRIWLLKQSKLGLWDMISSCNRDSSLDSSLYDEEVNDIASLLEKYPSIERVAFTGRKAQSLYEVNFSHIEIERVYLPSPSSAYAKMKLEDKIIAYSQKLDISYKGGA